jgi:outer membrane protein TolC
MGQPAAAAAVPADTFDGGTVPVDLAAAVLASPEIPVLDRSIDEAAASERLAQAMRTPDPTLSGGLLLDAQPEFMYGWKVGLGITLPLFTRHNAAVQVESARLAQLRAEREARIAELTGQAGAAAARADAARRQYLRYRDEILPQLTAIEAMAEDSYRSGQTGLSAFLLALQAARETRLRATDAGLAYQEALADLERALGGPIR